MYTPMFPSCQNECGSSNSRILASSAASFQFMLLMVRPRNLSTVVLLAESRAGALSAALGKVLRSETAMAVNSNAQSGLSCIIVVRKLPDHAIALMKSAGVGAGRG